MAGQQNRISTQEMLHFCVTVSCVLFGSASGHTNEEKCYGSSMIFPMSYSPPSFKGRMYFTPSSGGPRKLIMDNGELKDPRLAISYLSAELKHLTERDQGTFSVMLSNGFETDVIRLKISDCSKRVTEYYGATYSSDVPSDAEFLEFTLLYSKDQPKVLWNRTDPQTNRGRRVQVARSGRSWEINDLTQADNGYYSFRAKDNNLLIRTRLEVKEHASHYNAKMDEEIFIENLFGGSVWTVDFKREDEEDYYFGTLIEKGRLQNRPAFKKRLQIYDDGIIIHPVRHGDSGTFEFRDQQGNLAQIVELVVEVEEEKVPTGDISCCLCQSMHYV